MNCSEDAVTLKNCIETDRMYDFLASLNVECDQVRVQTLGKEDLPSLNEVISITMAEESRQKMMLEPKTIDGSAMPTNGANSRGSKSD